jgi:hypothetical protein
MLPDTPRPEQASFRGENGNSYIFRLAPKRDVATRRERPPFTNGSAAMATASRKRAASAPESAARLAFHTGR